MDLSKKWLQDFVDVSDISIKDYCDRMTFTGSKVESFEEKGKDIENVLVGKVVEIVRHPNSDHMFICQVDVGQESPVQIVTGAQNVFSGALVPAAVAPAKLPGGVTIKAGKLRGEDSNGMLCSIAELGLTTHEVPYAIEDGILILEEDCKPGDDIKDVLDLRDDVVEFEITSNRPDCLSVIGLARETAVSFDRKLNIKSPSVKESDGDISDYLSVEDKAPDLCMRYSARVIKNVRIAPSPLWMRMRLSASGVRPINNIVDITNYVMLEYGQPMHAFDYKMLDGANIVVRRAEDGEKFISLDSQEHILNHNNLVIADGKKAVALAGVMGGENSEITDDTTTVVFESACFDGASVRITAKSQGMRTESSSRFEKGLDSDNCIDALERACELVNELGAGEVVKGIIDVYPTKKKVVKLPLEVERINRFLGVDLSKEYMVDVLEKLGFEVDENNVITSPHWRSDIGEMNDIAEEIIRIYGYNMIESTPFKCEVAAGSFTPRQTYRSRVDNLLCAMGLTQSNTFSFVSPKDHNMICLPEDSPLRKTVTIRNPLGEDTSVMRTTLIPSLLNTLAHNNAHNIPKAAMYEVGHIYLPKDDPNELPDEPYMIALGFYGYGDFYQLKSYVDEIFEDAGITQLRYEAKKDDPTFHPGRCAEIYIRGNMKIGILGQIHPTVAKNYGFSQPVFIAYLPFEDILSVANFEKHYKGLSKHPSTFRDLALVCDRELEVGKIESVIRKASGHIVESIELFDIYVGEKVADDKKSVAYRITFRSPDHTLTDEEINNAVQKILNSLDKNLSVKIRE
ncbi:MAG: phenylalanine--tRNA ligase subunit beta [Clostridia bacterium]|nr:phenylalanine--tRNA ligase subunit beta [Clostridia bacterium]